MSTRHLDFIVIAPLPEELRAVRYAVASPSHLVGQSPFPHFECDIELSTGARAKGAIFSQHAVGRAHAAALTTYILVNFRTTLIVVVGLCGALRNTRHALRLGDVVFADTIVDGEIRKLAFGGYEMQTEHWTANSDHRAIATEVQTSFRYHRFHAPDETTYAWYRSTDFSMATGTVVSLGSVIADAETSHQIGKKASAASGVEAPMAVEMEGNGVLTAARIFGAESSVAMIRAVNDFANEQKPEAELHSRKMACENAAFVSLAFIRAALEQHGGRRLLNQEK